MQNDLTGAFPYVFRHSKPVGLIRGVVPFVTRFLSPAFSPRQALPGRREQAENPLRRTCSLLQMRPATAPRVP